MNTVPVSEFLADRFAHWAVAKPDETALTYLERSWTWAQWWDRVCRLAGALHQRGIGRGDVVSFLDKNHPACIELTFACSLIGAANAIINFRLTGDEVDYAVNDAGSRLLLVGTDLLPLVDKLVNGPGELFPRVEHVVALTPDGGEGDEYESMLASATPVDREPQVTPDDVVLVMYSSGTTGRPKGVMLTQRGMVTHTANVLHGWPFAEDDVNLVAMPLFHVGGSSFVQLSIRSGVASILVRDPDVPSLVAAIAAGATKTFLVPAVLTQLLQSGAQNVAMFGRLRSYLYGASPMPLPLLRTAMETWPDVDFCQAYGLTEVGGVATLLAPEDHREGLAHHPEWLVSAGRPLRDLEVRVVDPATFEDVPEGEHGEIWMRTPQLMKGFLGKPEATAEVVREDGWFRTGDLGRVDAEGFVYVEDRIKDLIISGGENIYSPEIERVLAEHPSVAEVAVIGVPHERWGETVKAVVALKPGSTPGESELIAYCREHLAAYKCPTSVDVVAALPRNPTGKIMKRELRKPYWDGRERSIV